MQVEPAIAFVAREQESPGIEIRINFGIFAGREVTSAELDELARAVVPKVGEASILAEERHEVGGDAEASLHQVRILVAPDGLPADEHELDQLSGRLIEIAETWARNCIAERHAEVNEP
jgi:hypothetical protein